MKKKIQYVQVVVSLFQGLIDEVETFDSCEKAYTFIEKKFEEQGKMYTDVCKGKITLDEYEEEYDEEADLEIHMYETELL